MMLSIVCVLLYTTVHVHGLGRTVLDGDVFIEFIGSIYEEPATDSDPSCTQIVPEIVQNIQAIRWTLSQLNSQISAGAQMKGFIPGVAIGLRVSQTCKKDGEAGKLALELATELQNPNGTDIVGILGSDSSSEAEVISRLISSLPEEYRLLQIGYATTSASLRNRAIYKNFYRTIPPDDIQVEVMLDFIERLRWTYMAIIFDDDSYGRGEKDGLLTGSKDNDVCFPVTIPVDTKNYSTMQLSYDIEHKIIRAAVPINGVLVFGSTSLAHSVLAATEAVMERFPNSTRPVFLFSEAGFNINNDLTDIVKGAFALSPPRRTISKFQNEWRNIFTNMAKLYDEIEWNPWLRDLYTSSFNCTLADEKDNNTCNIPSNPELDEAIPASVYNQYAIQAALVIVRVIQDIYEEKCQPNSGVCQAFRDTNETPRGAFVHKLSAISEINFDHFGTFRQDEFQAPAFTVSFNNSSDVTYPDNFPLYEVYNHQICNNQTGATCLVKVATYKASKQLDVEIDDIKDYGGDGEELSRQDISKPQCPDGSFCAKCFEEQVEDSFFFIPGDMYIVAIVPVHNTGSTPLKCGSITYGSLDIVESIRFAVSEAKTKPNANIGIIVIDSCNDPNFIRERILILHMLGVYNNGEYEFVGDKILGYIGGSSSSVSEAIAEITSRLGYPQISYASTASVLSDRKLYPYFLRIPSPDDKQAETMLKIVKKLGGNFIQIVYSKSTYGQGGRDVLLELIGTSQYDICVAQTLPMSIYSDRTAILSDLRKFPEAKIIVSFLGSADFEYMINTFNSMERNEFQFISSEGWGTRLDVGGLSNLIGSITLASHLQINEKMKDHMKLLKPDHLEANPWVRPYMEFTFDCYFEWSYNKTSGQSCIGTESLDVYTTDYRIDVWSAFAEHAVTALLHGARVALENACNGDTANMCDAFRNNTQDFVDAIRNVRLQGDVESERIFDDNGDGRAGYEIYAVHLTEDGQYSKIGTSELNDGETATEQVYVSFREDVFDAIRGEHVESRCTNHIDKCNECFSGPPEAVTTPLPVGFVVAVVVLSVVCCVLLAILLCICNRNGCCFKIENGQVMLTYLKPVQDRRRSNINDAENYDVIRDHSSKVNYYASVVERQVSEASEGRVVMSRRGTGIMGNQQLRGMLGNDNVAVESASKPREDSYLNSELTPDSFGSASKPREDSYLNSELTPDSFGSVSKPREDSYLNSELTQDAFGSAAKPREDSYLNSELTSEVNQFKIPSTAPKLPPARMQNPMYQPDECEITSTGAGVMLPGSNTSDLIGSSI